MLPHPLVAAAAGLVLSVTVLAAAYQPIAEAHPRQPLAGCAITGECPPAFAVGDVAQGQQLHIIRNPGLYGLAVPPQGTRYAIFQGRIIRIDRQTGQIRSILRAAPGRLD